MRIAVGALTGVATVHLLGQLTGAALLADTTQVLLMPAVLVVLLRATTAPRRRLVRLTMIALVLSWLGDTAPRVTAGETSFLLMVACFLLAQLVYAAAFWPYRRRSILRRPALMAAYVLVAVAIVLLCAPAAEELLIAVAFYAAAITVMAVLATGLGPRAGGGAAVFVVSDALIALDAFGVLTLPGHEFWVMSTYIAAQVLLMDAVRRRAGAETVAGPAADRPRDV